MNTIIVDLFKADLLEKEEIPDVYIHITDRLPEFKGKDCFKNAEELYEKEAERLEDILQKCLPQGVKDRLLIKLMKRKVSLYRGITS